MSTITIPPGIVRGANSAAVPGRWYDSNLVRSVGGVTQAIMGWERISSDPIDSPIRAIHPTEDLSGVRRLILGCDTQLLVLEGGSVSDVTPTDFVGGSALEGADGFGVDEFGVDEFGTPRSTSDLSLLRAQSWSLTEYGQDVLAVRASDGRLLHWQANSPSTVATVVANAPSNIRAAIVTPQRHVVVAGTSENERRIAWSSRDAITDWTFAGADSLTNTAGWLDIQSRGIPLRLTSVPEGTLIHTDSDVYRMTWTGGNDVFGIGDALITNSTLLSPNAIVAIPGGAVWLTRYGAMIYSSGTIRTLPIPINDLFEGMDQKNGPLLAHGSALGSRPEVWWFYPAVGSEACDRYVIWDYDANIWWCGRLARAAACPAGVWGSPIMAGPDGRLYQHEQGWSDAGLPRDVYLETSVLTGEGAIAILRGQLGAGSTYDATTVRAITRPTLNAPETTGPIRTPLANGYTPMRDGGRNVRIRLDATKAGSWSVGNPIFDLIPIGAR